MNTTTTTPTTITNDAFTKTVTTATHHRPFNEKRMNEIRNTDLF